MSDNAIKENGNPLLRFGGEAGGGKVVKMNPYLREPMLTDTVTGMDICYYNDAIGCMEVDMENLADGLEFAGRCGTDSVRILTLNDKHGRKMPLDLRPLRNAQFLRRLIIADDTVITKVIDIEALESLPQLESLSLQSAIKVDVSRLATLKELCLRTDKSVTGLNALPRIERLLIRSAAFEDLRHISDLTSLKRLEISGTKLKSLSGIERFGNLSYLGLSYCPSLENIEAIKCLPNLRTLHVERCKRLFDLSALAGNGTINKLFASDISSIEFLPAMTALEQVSFWNCIDGDLHPLLGCRRLKDFYFYPDKRHYTHTLKEMRGLFLKDKQTT